jgi:hypothetical protein
MRTLKQRKTGVLRARCEEHLLYDVQRAANVLNLDQSDIIRIGVREKVSQILRQTRFNAAMQDGPPS